jgi:hypothetical protein
MTGRQLLSRAVGVVLTTVVLAKYVFSVPKPVPQAKPPRKGRTPVRHSEGQEPAQTVKETVGHITLPS